MVAPTNILALGAAWRTAIRPLTPFVLLVAAVLPSNAAAQSYPSRPIHIVVPSAAGGSPDILARLVGNMLATRLGKPVVIDNKPGGAGNIAAQAVVNALPDGYTLLVASDQNSINETLYRGKLRFSVKSSFAPIVVAVTAPQVLAVNAQVPARNVREFVKLAEAEPGKFALASPANGTTGALGVLLFKSQAEIKITPVPYRSAQPAITDVVGGQVQGIVVTVAPALSFIKSGHLRALGVSSAYRSSALADVPTFVEQGFPKYKFDTWLGFVAPVGTPPAIVERLNREINAILGDPEIRGQLQSQGFSIAGGSPEAMRKQIVESIRVWEDVIRSNDIKLD
jgi:tripartite-type tricarboxylate transporter receptor subunit TctC